MNQRKVICQDCMVAGQTSIVRSNQLMTMQKGQYDHYYDEQGNYHRHNPDITIESFTCSKGHSWKERWSVKCSSCDFQVQLREIVR